MSECGMRNTARPIAFILASTNHGTLIVNRNDYRMIDESRGFDVGFQLLNTSNFDPTEVELECALLLKRRQYFGDGVVAVDCGANIGVRTIEWARLMHDWGSVFSFEAQEKIFYALAGNVAINNCLNVVARNVAVGDKCATLQIPEPNYLTPSSYGSFELIKRDTTEFIGQMIDYNKTREIPLISIDSLNFGRLDYMKIDVEGMEEAVLAGAMETLARCKPILLVENIKSNKESLSSTFVKLGYKPFDIGINTLAFHTADPTIKHLSVTGNSLNFST